MRAYEAKKKLEMMGAIVFSSAKDTIMKKKHITEYFFLMKIKYIHSKCISIYEM